MMPGCSGGRSAAFTVVFLAVAVLAAGCGRPSDEAWLRFLGFKQGASTITVFNDTLREPLTTTTADTTVDAEFQNGSQNIGQKNGGVGVTLYRVRIDYRMAGYSPPSTEYSVTLYLPAPTDSTATEGTLSDFPLVPASLKNWIIAAGVNSAVVDLSARATFFGETDDGGKVETEGSIGISLTNMNAQSK